MPYGIKKEAGGDTAANDARMEKCVQAVMGRGHSKVSAIKICKTSLFSEKRKKPGS